MFTINGKSVIKGSVEEDDPKEMKHEIEDLKKQGWKPHYGKVKETEGV